MRNLFRWIGFTIGTVLVAIMAGFAVMFLGRLYGTLLSPEFLMVYLFVFSAAVALAAINFASKLDREQEEATGAAGGPPPPSPRPARRRARQVS